MQPNRTGSALLLYPTSQEQRAAALKLTKILEHEIKITNAEQVWTNKGVVKGVPADIQQDEAYLSCSLSAIGVELFTCVPRKTSHTSLQFSCRFLHPSSQGAYLWATGATQSRSTCHAPTNVATAGDSATLQRYASRNLFVTTVPRSTQEGPARINLDVSIAGLTDTQPKTEGALPTNEGSKFSTWPWRKNSPSKRLNSS